MIIDKLAYNSKLRNIAPISKLLFSMSVLVICIWANSFLVSVFTALTMLFLIIFIGKTSYKNVFHLMTVPIVFIIMGSAAIAISIGQNSSDMLFSLHFGNTYFGVSHTSILSAVRVMIKCFGAVSCMYFLSLTTPMVDLFTLLRKSIIPNFIIEIAELFTDTFLCCLTYRTEFIPLRRTFGVQQSSCKLPLNGTACVKPFYTFL